MWHALYCPRRSSDCIDACCRHSAIHDLKPLGVNPAHNVLENQPFSSGCLSIAGLHTEAVVYYHKGVKRILHRRGWRTIPAQWPLCKVGMDNLRPTGIREQKLEDHNKNVKPI